MLNLPNNLILDLETSIKNRGEDAVGNMQASPFHPDNKIVLGGYKFNNDPVVIEDGSVLPVCNTQEIIVGQNIKFDLLYLIRASDHWYENLPNLKIWDTMLAEYLLTGQDSKMASLDSLSKKYGGTTKPDKIKEYWEAGIDTEDIPLNELYEYLEGDVENTYLVFHKQYAQAIELGMLPLIEAQMDMLLATVEMENNGMHFDVFKCKELLDDLIAKHTAAYDELVSEMSNCGIQEPNPSSTQHISLFMFGGEQSVKKNLPVYDDDGNEVKYKSGLKKGQTKTKKQDVTMCITGLGLVPKTEWEGKKKGFYSTSDEVISVFSEVPAMETLKKYRELDKDLTTYFKGFTKHYWPTDNCIHGQLNMAITATGRLSSSNPNMQNLSNKRDED